MLDRSGAIEVSNPTMSDAGSARLNRSFLGRLIAAIRGLGWLFIVTVAAPTLCAILYFGLLASDVYLSESKFVVRAPDKPAASGLGIILKSAGFSNAGDEVYAARDFLVSRDATRELEKSGKLRAAYSRPGISMFDRFDPFGLDGSFEALVKYYKNKVSVEFDSSSSITTLVVRAYTPRDAQSINAELLGQSEALVNQLNRRGQADLISVAAKEVAEAKEVAAGAAVALAAFRNREGVVDPDRQATVQLQMVSKLQDQLIATRTQLLQLKTYTPQNPQIPVLQAGEKSLSAQIAQEQAKIAGADGSLSSSAVRYQRLMLDNQFAEKQLAAAMASLEEARNEARRKQAYVERIVEPSLPDAPLEPRRLRGIAATFVLGLIAWGIAAMLLAGVREHKD